MYSVIIVFVYMLRNEENSNNYYDAAGDEEGKLTDENEMLDSLNIPNNLFTIK